MGKRLERAFARFDEMPLGMLLMGTMINDDVSVEYVPIPSIMQMSEELAKVDKYLGSVFAKHSNLLGNSFVVKRDGRVVGALFMHVNPDMIDKIGKGIVMSAFPTKRGCDVASLVYGMNLYMYKLNELYMELGIPLSLAVIPATEAGDPMHDKLIEIHRKFIIDTFIGVDKNNDYVKNGIYFYEIGKDAEDEVLANKAAVYVVSKYMKFCDDFTNGRVAMVDMDDMLSGGLVNPDEVLSNPGVMRKRAEDYIRDKYGVNVRVKNLHKI